MTQKSTLLFTFLACLFQISTPLLGQAGALVIEGATLSDGTGRDPVRDAVIVIEGGRIRAISQKGKLSPPPGARVIAAQGKYVIPGLVDFHVHFREWMPQLLVAHGVTTIFDIGNDPKWIFAVKDGIAKGKIFGPRMFASGLALGDTGDWRHDPEHPDLKTVEQTRDVVRGLIAQGADVLKVYNALPAENLRAVVMEGERAGLPVVGHCPLALDAKQAALMGQKHLEHATGVAKALAGDPQEYDALMKKAGNAPWAPAIAFSLMEEGKVDDLIQTLVRQGLYVEPNIITVHRSVARSAEKHSSENSELLRDPKLNYIPDSNRVAISTPASFSQVPQELANDVVKGYQNFQEFVRRFVAAGGKVIAATDSLYSTLAGIGMHQEMENLVDIGLTPLQAIQAATKHPAELGRKIKDLGTLEEGKFADLLILQGDPLADIRNTRKIETVIKAGEIMDTRYDKNFVFPLPKPPAVNIGANPIPEIESLSPEVAVEGDPEFSLALRGRGFISSSRVHFNGQPVTTEFVSPFELRARIPARLVAGAGTFAVTVRNPQPLPPVPNAEESTAAYFIVRFK